MIAPLQHLPLVLHLSHAKQNNLSLVFLGWLVFVCFLVWFVFFVWLLVVVGAVCSRGARHQAEPAGDLPWVPRLVTTDAGGDLPLEFSAVTVILYSPLGMTLA